MVRRAKEYYEFCEFRVDVSERLLLRNGKTVALTPKVFDTLLYLVENSGHILSKDEVMGHVWADSIVEEANLTRNISVLRKALGEGPDQLQYIETIPWRGYRFIPDVRRIGDDNEELLIEEHTSSRVVIEHEVNLPETAARAENARLLSRWGLAAILTGCVAAVMLITASILYSIRGGDDKSSTVAVSSVAVLPLENLSGDPAQEYFADGMTEALINNLARLRDLKVISRASVMRYKGTTKSVTEVAGELGVDAVITGSVQRSGDRVRVTAQMINATTDTHLWAREYDREVADILKLEGEIAREVAQEIQVQFTSDERIRLASARKIDPRAHEAYLLGRFHFSKNDEHHLRLAVEHFERAVALAPDYAPAYAGLSDTWVARGLVGTVDFRETETPARSAALKAIELDEQLSEGHLALASVKQHFDWDWSGAEQEIRRALELDPGSLVAHTEYAYLLANVGRFDEAVRQGRIVVQLDPVAWSAHSALGRILYRARLYDEALLSLQKAAELEPQGLTPHYRLGDVYTQLGRYDEALSAYKRAGKAMSKGGYPDAGIARLYALMGKREEATQMVGGLKDNPYIIASVHAALGDRNEAFRILEKAVAENQLMTPVKVEPPLESLHSDPRWKALLDRMNLPTE